VRDWVQGCGTGLVWSAGVAFIAWCADARPSLIWGAALLMLAWWLVCMLTVMPRGRN
jgi:hypothetical protein